MTSLSSVKKSDSEENLMHAAQTGHTDVINTATIQKFPIRRLRPSIQKFQIVLEIDLDRLQKHRLNIDRLTAIEDWVGLHKEQVNASRTVQQVKANLRELERARAQVEDEDVDKFDLQVQSVKMKAIAAVTNFLQISPVEQILPDAGFKASLVSDTNREHEPGDSISLPDCLPQLNTQIRLHVVPENSQAAASWEELQQNMEELNEMVHQFAAIVQKQGEAVDRIEENIETARENVREATLSLGAASKLKSVMFPVAGALIGGVVAGPVGFLAGIKIGGIAGAVGGTAGFVGGKLLKDRQQRIVSMEMQNLSEQEQQSRGPQRSTSTPELSQSSHTECNKNTSLFSRLFSWGESESHATSEG